MAGKRQNILTQKSNRQHRSNVKGAIKNGLLMGNARMKFLQQPAVRKEMKDWYKKNVSGFKRQSI